MGEYIEGTYRTELVSPIEAGQYDPPMQEWLALPVAESCPEGPSHIRWGTSNPRGYFRVCRCNEYLASTGQRCQGRWRHEVTPHMIREVVGALTNEIKRFGR